LNESLDDKGEQLEAQAAHTSDVRSRLPVGRQTVCSTAVILRLFSGVVRSRCGGVTRGRVVLGGLRVVARSGVCRGVVLWRFCVVNCLSIGVVIWNGGLVVAQG
jgi:hypothetical protein